MKNILVISTSPRKGGNSETLADAFIRGAEEAGHKVEKVCLYDKTIGFCKGCLACLKSHRCVIHDDADAIAQKWGRQMYWCSQRQSITMKCAGR